MSHQWMQSIKVSWQPALMTALLLFALLTAINTISPEQLSALANQTNTTNYMEKGSNFLLWAQSLQSITPAWRFNVLNGQYIVGLNDIPFPDSSDLIGIMIPTIFLAWIFRRKKLSENAVANVIYKLLLILMIMLLIFCIWKHIVYRIYLYESSQLGMDAAEAISIRENLLIGLSNVALPMFIVCMFTGYSIFKIFKTK